MQIKCRSLCQRVAGINGIQELTRGFRSRSIQATTYDPTKLGVRVNPELETYQLMIHTLPTADTPDKEVVVLTFMA